MHRLVWITWSNIRRVVDVEFLRFLWGLKLLGLLVFQRTFLEFHEIVLVKLIFTTFLVVRNLRVVLFLGLPSLCFDCFLFSSTKIFPTISNKACELCEIQVGILLLLPYLVGEEYICGGRPDGRVIVGLRMPLVSALGGN